MSLYLGNNLVSGVATPTEPTRNLGQIIPSTIPLTDAGLHLLDGSLIQGDGIYSAFVTAMAAIYGTNPELFCTEQEWQQSVTDYGVCGKFVYDSVNNTIRLQKFYSAERYLIASFSSGTDWYRVYSDGWCEQGGWGTGEPLVNSARHYDLLIPMANINYFVTAISKRTDSEFYQSNPASIVDVTTTSFGVRIYSNTIYELTWEVKGYIDISTYKQQTQYQYIVIATSTKTDIEVDIDEIATDLNGKADVDLTNCTDVANIKMAHNAMPSDTYEDLTLGSSGATYTAPADGYIYIYRTGLSNGNATYIASSGAVGSKSVAVTGSLVTQNFLPVRKNVTFSVTYSGAATSTTFRFTYAKGSESEAS